MTLYRLRAAFRVTLAAYAAATLLSACGDSGVETSSVGSGSPNGSLKPKARSEKVGTERSGGWDDSPTHRTRKDPTTGPTATGTPTETLHEHGVSAGHSDPGRCPEQIAPRQCAELVEAKEHPRPAKNQTDATTDCPPALSKSECLKVREVQRQAAKGKQVPPGECPPALSDPQCRELEAAYRETG